MSTDPYIGNISIFAGNFAPLSWRICDGTLMSIAEYTALFSLIGTTYGGDGQTTFALPDLRGRVAINQGQGLGLSPYYIGQVGGAESVTLTAVNLATHTHTGALAGNPPVSTSTTNNLASPVNNVPAGIQNINAYETAANTTLNPTAINGQTPIAGGSQPVSVLSPYLAMNYVIAIEGIYPSRN
jgi:microcystin-dependent protein